MCSAPAYTSVCTGPGYLWALLQADIPASVPFWQAMARNHWQVHFLAFCRPQYLPLGPREKGAFARTGETGWHSGVTAALLRPRN